MARVIDRFVPVEMAVIGLLEALLCFGFFYATLAATGPTLANRSALLAAIIASSAIVIGLYRPEICLDRRRLVLNVSVAAILAFPAALIVCGQFGDGLTRTYAMALAKVLMAWLAFAIAVRFLASTMLRPMMFPRRILTVGAPGVAYRLSGALTSGRGRMFELLVPVSAGTVPEDLAPPALQRRRIWAVIATAEALDDTAGRQREQLIASRLHGVRVYDEAAFWEQHLSRVNLECLAPAWFLQAEGFNTSWISLAIKRLIDLAVSLVLLILTFPLMLATAIAIKLDSPGPVFYRQERVGLRGRVFTLTKFRSMRSDAEAGGKPRWATKRDPRVTRVGAFIRQTRIDELPQLLNVLGGEMSLVGPRPERPHFVEQLAQVIPFYNERSTVKPGVTGWAQVNYPYGASVEDAREKLSYDLYYVKNRGIFLDISILLSTVRVILFREGAR